MDSPRPDMASVAQRTVLISFITIVFMSSITLNKPSMMLSSKAGGLTQCGGFSTGYRELQEVTYLPGSGRCPLSSAAMPNSLCLGAQTPVSTISQGRSERLVWISWRIVVGVLALPSLAVKPCGRFRGSVCLKAHFCLAQAQQYSQLFQSGRCCLLNAWG